MSAQPAPGASPRCPLCGTTVVAADERCPSCGRDLAGVAGRPGPVSRTALLSIVAGFVLIYLVVLAIVALAR